MKMDILRTLIEHFFMIWAEKQSEYWLNPYQHGILALQ